MKYTLLFLFLVSFNLSFAQLVFYPSDCSTLTMECEKDLVFEGNSILMEVQVMEGVWTKVVEQKIFRNVTDFIVDDNRFYRISLIDRRNNTSTMLFSNNAQVECIKSKFKDNSDISIYPNPSNNILNVNIGLGECIDDCSVDFEIYNIMGVRMFDGVLSGNSNAISISELSSGIYMFHCSNRNFNFIFSKQFIVDND